MTRAHRNPAAVRRHAEAFERRFTRIDAGVVYARDDFDAGVVLPPPLAAELIAGMRAGLDEADGRARFTLADALPAIVAVPLLLVMLGAITDYAALTDALTLPAIAAILLLGPGLGALRLSLAFRRGVAEAEAAMAGFDAAPRGTVPGNRARSAVGIVALFAGAVVFGLVIAGWSAPVWQRDAVDRFAGTLAGPILILVIALAVASAILDLRRRRVSEADIRAANLRRGRRPLD